MNQAIPSSQIESSEDPQALRAAMKALGERARAAARLLAEAPSEAKRKALEIAADLLEARSAEILAANAEDMARAEARGLSGSMLDRLLLDEARLKGIARGLREVAATPDPVGEVIADWTRPNGLRIRRVRTPIGVIGIIYESRPNVTADAGALCVKSGNAAILRGGSESFASSGAILEVIREGLKAAGLPEDAVQRVPTRDRAAVGILLGEMVDYVDVIVPRGGRSLVERVQKEARVPVFAHLEGICHLYVDRSADMTKAVPVAVNAKMRRTGICGSAECLLFDKASPEHVAPIVAALAAAGCEIRGDEGVRALAPEAVPAAPEDFGHEFLAPIIAAKMVDGVEGAIDHIRRYGSGHTESILAEDSAPVARFFQGLDSAILMHNASTQFADGGEFGMGAEIGIATGKLHARGPVGAEQLTSFKYLVTGDGTTRK